MTDTKRVPLHLILALLLFGVTFISPTGATAQVRLNPNLLPSMSINTACEGDRAVFKIRNGLQPWAQPGEIIVLSEEERRIVSRRKMRFASNQKATYRVPLKGANAASGALRIVLVLGHATKTPIAHARLDCTER